MSPVFDRFNHTDDRPRSPRARCVRPFALVLPPEAMPRGRRTNPPDEAEKWQAPSFKRLSDRAKERRESRAAPTEERFDLMATRPIDKLALGEPIAPGEEKARRSAEQTAQYAFRTSEEGQMAAGFSPHRHSVVVCGRPVQVTVGRNSSQCTFFGLILQIYICVLAVGLFYCVSELIALTASKRYLSSRNESFGILREGCR